jgi:hypothetical protein
MPSPAFQFRGVPFRVALVDNKTPRGSRTLRFSREQIPFSAGEVIDIGGTGALTFAGMMLVTPAHISDFEVQLGQVGSLVWDTLTVNALMTKCDSENMLFDGTLYWVAAEFVEAVAGSYSV